MTTALVPETPSSPAPHLAPPSAAPAHRIEYVDGLRAVAVLAVVLDHVGRAMKIGLPYDRFFGEGAHGVDLFFVLSGFCLAFPTLALLRRKGAATFDVIDYAAKRLVRIVPPFYLATIAIVAIFALPHYLRHEHLGVAMPYPIDILKSFVFLDERVQLVNGAFWTLMVEFRWYFLFPLLLMLWVRSPRAFAAIAVASFVLFHFTRARSVDLGTLPGFMLGIVAADIQLGGDGSRSFARHVKRWALPLAVACGALGVATETHATIPGFYGRDVTFPWQPTILGWQLAAFFFAVFAGSFAPLRRVLGMRALVATGIASYGIYLVHEPAIEFAVARFHGPFTYPVGAAAALVVGFGFWAIADRPFMSGKLRKRMLRAVAPVMARAAAFVGVRDRFELREPAAAEPAA